MAFGTKYNIDNIAKNESWNPILNISFGFLINIIIAAMPRELYWSTSLLKSIPMIKTQLMITALTTGGLKRVKDAKNNRNIIVAI